MQKEVTMNRIIKIGADVHSKTFSICALEVRVFEEPRVLACERVTADYRNVIKFIECLKEKLGSSDRYDIECGYEAGCLGYSLYHQLTAAHIKCRILAPSTILQPNGIRVKTDAHDAEWIARQLAWNSCRFVHIPTEEDLATKEFIRMRADHQDALKRIKQQINGFCMRHGKIYEKTKWTLEHLRWLRSLALSAALREVLNEYLATYDHSVANIARLDARIKELAEQKKYAAKVKELCCLLGIKTHTALSIIAEVGDFIRFAKGNVFAAYLGLAPGERSSGEHICRTGITKAGNSYLRRLLIESAAGLCKGAIGHKSKALQARQAGNRAEVIAYADKANIRLRSKYYRMIRHGKKRNVAVTAVARELACFIWGMMTDNIAFTARELAAS